MKQFLQTRVGQVSIVAFILLMAIVSWNITARRAGRRTQPAPKAHSAVGAMTAVAAISQERATQPAATPAEPASGASSWTAVAEDTAYLDRYYKLEKRTREEQDARGVTVTRRQTATTPADAAHLASLDDVGVNPIVAGRSTLRLQGRGSAAPSEPTPSALVLGSQSEGSKPLIQSGAFDVQRPPERQTTESAAAAARRQPKRFNPYGSVIKCELVFTLDSASEETPLVALVMEPVYNNGALVIPAGAELHGVARPDRLRDRICSGESWVLVFPREQERPNGRQLMVKGVALERAEPDANGMTWGITDGSFGMQGQVIRTMNDEEIKRFVATFLGAAVVTLQQRETNDRGQQSVRNSPQNAVLQGLAANLEQVASGISTEIAQHGVFIRVPAGHQFYFYPMQVIDSDAAAISTDVSTQE